MKTTRIIYDGTNPEQEERAYLKIIEVRGEIETPERLDGIPYINLTDHPDIDRALKEPLAVLTIDFERDLEELVSRAPKEMKALWETDGVLHEDDKYVVAVQTIYLDLMDVTGAEGVHWPYF